MKRLLFSVAVVLSLAGQSSAHGVIQTGNQRLDRAIYAGHDPKLIVAGQIVKRNVVTFPDWSGPADFRFKIATVILGDDKYTGQTLTIPVTSFVWPNDLLPFENGIRCVLVLRTGWGQKRDGYYLYSVWPVSTTDLRTAKDGEGAKSILAEQILTVLKNERSANRQRHLILQVSPILPKDATDVFAPFLESDDTWLRRAALAGLVYATKEPKYLTMTQKDIEKFVETTDPFSTINGPDDRSGHYRLLFSHYFFLSVGWSREDDASASAYLPLFRLVAQSKQVPEWIRWKNSVNPLCRAGTREDAKFLYDYCRDRKSKEKQEIFRFSSYRQEIIMGISRIFDLGLSNWVESDFLKKEQSQHQSVTEVLVKQGIVQKADAHSHPEQVPPPHKE